MTIIEQPNQVYDETKSKNKFLNVLHANEIIFFNRAYNLHKVSALSV